MTSDPSGTHANTPKEIVREADPRDPDPAADTPRAASHSGVARLPVASEAEPSSLLEELLDAPFEFEFDAAVAILRRATHGQEAAIRYRAATGLGFASSDVLAVARGEADRFDLTTGFLGLTGPAGVLPRVYTEHVIAERRQRSSALADFLDFLAQRPIAQFASVAAKYRPHRIREEAALDDDREDTLRATILALTGHAIPAAARSLGPVLEAVLHHSGAFATHPRSADRLAALLSDVFGRPVTLRQFAGRWVRLDPGERTSLPRTGADGRFHQLGIDATAGAAFWDIQSRVSIRIGPLSLDEFRAFLPGGPALAALRTLASAYLDDTAEFEVNPVLAAAEVPPLALPTGTVVGARLGQDSWLTAGAPRRRDADDALLNGTR